MLTCIRKSKATFLGWRVNKGTKHVPKWVCLAGAPKGYILGGEIVINWMVPTDQYNVANPERRARVGITVVQPDDTLDYTEEDVHPFSSDGLGQQ